MTTNPKIVAVDDEPSNLHILKQLLKSQYELAFANGGEEGFDVIARHTPDLILLDVMMPHVNGHDLCRRLKADVRLRHIPIIFVTAMGDEDNESLGFELGASDYITKPFRPAVLKARIATHLALHNQQRTLREMVDERTAELNETRLEVIQRLGCASEYKDDETGLHIIRMSHYTRILAEASGVPRLEVERIFHAAPMHDIGKIGIPDRILLKPSSLNAEEWATMKQHPKIGADILGENPAPLFEMARSIALGHHERWNGSGYPKGLSGEAIPLEARLVSVADVFDALTSKRPYKEPWPLSKAVSYMQEQAGQLFDPTIIGHFMANLDQITVIMHRLSEPREQLKTKHTSKHPNIVSDRSEFDTKSKNIQPKPQ